MVMMRGGRLPASGSGKKKSRQIQGASRLMVAGGVCCLGLVGAGWVGGLRVNATPSYPLGLWRIAPLTRPVGIGDRVFICLPEGPGLSVGLARGYVRRGLCSGGAAPLIKRIVALAGQHVTIEQAVSVDGRAIPNSRIAAADVEARQLIAYEGGLVPAGHLFLHSDYPGSYDSRYFGPVPAVGVLGMAEPILTVDP